MANLHVTDGSSLYSYTPHKTAKKGQNPADKNLFDNHEVISNIYQIAMTDGKADFNKSELGMLRTYYKNIKSKISESVANFVDNILYGNKNYTNEQWEQIIGNMNPEVKNRAEEATNELEGTMSIIEYLQQTREADAADE